MTSRALYPVVLRPAGPAGDLRGFGTGISAETPAPSRRIDDVHPCPGEATTDAEEAALPVGVQMIHP
ncbi:hypothetical protein ABZV29_29655 [Streptomyces sp. NPDC005236]|uniref:hypothetical protein n=1 Tax=Streptomyces sp. NPDC005236 TaxID=3157028 RepID=UPI0033B6A148